MSATLLNKEQLAQRMGTTPGIAARLLLDKGVSPVDLGCGRGRGLRWYSLAVDTVIRQIHEEAQQLAAPGKKIVRKPKKYTVLGRSVQDLYEELTNHDKLQ